MRFYQHPNYPGLKKDWDQYSAYYHGDRDTLLKSYNLWKHEYETDTVKGGSILRAIREERTRYVNLCVSIVQKYISLTFQNAIDFSEVEDWFTEEEWEDIDGQGRNVETYISEKIARDFYLYGRVVDEITSDANGRVYFQHWEPQSVIDWQMRHDEFEFYTMTYQEILERQTAHEEPKMQDYLQYLRFNESGKYEPIIYLQQGSGKESTWTEVNRVDTGLDFMPVSVCDGSSWVARILPIMMIRYNLQSALDNILNYQAYQKMFISGDNLEGTGMIVNEAGITLLPEGATVSTIDPVDPVALRNRLEGVTADLWRVAFFQNRMIPSDSRATESAANQIAQKDDLFSAIAVAGEHIAAHVNSVIRNFALYKKKDPGSAYVNFDFKVVIDDEEFYTLAGLFLNDVKQYSTWTKEVYKRVAKKMRVEDIDAVMAEIDATQPLSVRRLTLADRINGNTE